MGTVQDMMTLALAAVVSAPSDADYELWRRPPYPTPPGWVAFQSAAFEALHERLDRGGADPFMTCRLYEPERTFVDSASRLVSGTRMFEPFDTVCHLLAGGIVSVGDVHTIIEALDVESLNRAHLQRAIVYRCLADGDVDQAAIEADSVWLGDQVWVGWRALGSHYAAAGDAKSLFGLWRRYEAGKERDQMARLKRTLVSTVAGEQGWRAALDLATDKRLGPAYAGVAFEPLAKSGDVDGLLELFDRADGLDAVAELTRLDLLVEALCASSDPNPLLDHPHLGEILARVIAIDPATSKAVMRQRDQLLFSLWPAIGEAATLQRVRAAVRTPSYRRELKRLPRDVPSAPRSPQSRES